MYLEKISWNQFTIRMKLISQNFLFGFPDAIIKVKLMKYYVVVFENVDFKWFLQRKRLEFRNAKRN